MCNKWFQLILLDPRAKKVLLFVYVQYMNSASVHAGSKLQVVMRKNRRATAIQSAAELTVHSPFSHLSGEEVIKAF